jgi:hypothetical protein
MVNRLNNKHPVFLFMNFFLINKTTKLCSKSMDNFRTLYARYTVKKVYSFSRAQPGCP